MYPRPATTIPPKKNPNEKLILIASEPFFNKLPKNVSNAITAPPPLIGLHYEPLQDMG